jgi:Ohr subfamily peroxiredoxin
MRTLYTAVSTARGGRDGHVRSSDGVLDLELKTPKEMGGPGGVGTNPEQLFAAGYAACFESAMRGVARKQKRVLADTRVTGHVSFNVSNDGKYMLSVDLPWRVLPGCSAAVEGARGPKASSSRLLRGDFCLGWITLAACPAPPRRSAQRAARQILRTNRGQRNWRSYGRDDS